MVYCEGRRFVFPTCLFVCTGLSMIVARHLSSIRLLLFWFIFSVQKQDGDFWEFVYFTLLDRQPFFEAVTDWVGIEIAELDEISKAICLKLCKLLFFLRSLLVAKNRCRLMWLLRVLIPLGTRSLLASLFCLFCEQIHRDWRSLGADLGFYLALLLFLSDEFGFWHLLIY